MEKISKTFLMSIPLLAMAVGVASAGVLHGGNHGDAATGAATTRAISQSDGRRICASLCMSGLGGKPCGESCQAIQPTDFHPQSADDNETLTQQQQQHVETPFPRRDACPLLCQYELGVPLCDCPPRFAAFDSIFFTIDFDRVCGFFCLRHGYRIYGCPACDAYRKDLTAQPYAIVRWPRKDIDWDAWCREKCAVGDGGVACNCDILPLSLPILDNNADED